MCIYIYVHIHVYIHICIYMYIYIYIDITPNNPPRIINQQGLCKTHLPKVDPTEPRYSDLRFDFQRWKPRQLTAMDYDGIDPQVKDFKHMLICTIYVHVNVYVLWCTVVHENYCILLYYIASYHIKSHHIVSCQVI